MLRAIDGLPEGVIGFEAEGEIRSADYTETLGPALQQELGAGRDIRIVLVFESWDGLSAGGVWEDLKLGTEHVRRWKKIALVTDIEWMLRVTALFGWMTPGEVKTFSLGERDHAIAWAATD
jgi:SpoIIAA-like